MAVWADLMRKRRDMEESIGQMEAKLAQKGVEERNEANREARQNQAKAMKEESAQADKAAKARASAAQAKVAAVQAAQDRVFSATHDAHERELHDMDRWYEAQQDKFRESAGTMAALQDAHHDERAARTEKANKERKESEQKARAALVAAVQAAQDRVFNATHDARERELHDMDRWYDAQRVKFRESAETMAALQDAYHEERAATLQRFAKEDAENQARKAAGGAWQAAPNLSSRFLTGIGQEQQTIQEAKMTNRLLTELKKLAERAEARETQTDSTLTVKVEKG